MSVSSPRTARQHAQSMVEFAIVSPVLILMVFLMIDFARLVYTYGAIAWAAREGARLATLSSAETSDCQILQRVESVGRGFPLVPDPNSVAGNSDPNNPVPPKFPTNPPPAGQGFIYVWPAVASAAPPDANCIGNPRQVTSTANMVAVQILYRYQPLLPLFNDFIPSITLKVISVVRTEY